jgi:hypothetical protein
MSRLQDCPCAPISGIEILSVSVIQTCLERKDPPASQHDLELADSGEMCCLNIGFTDGQRLVWLPMSRSSRARRRSCGDTVIAFAHAS